MRNVLLTRLAVEISNTENVDTAALRIGVKSPRAFILAIVSAAVASIPTAVVSTVTTVVSTVTAVTSTTSVVRRSRVRGRRGRRRRWRRRIFAASIVGRWIRVRRSRSGRWIRWRRRVLAAWRRARVGGGPGESASREDSDDCELHYGEVVIKRLLDWWLGVFVKKEKLMERDWMLKGRNHRPYL